MPKRSSKSADPNKRAFQVVQEATDEKPPRKKNAAAVALGRKGGRKGGKARAAKLTPQQRADIARTAALARWHKKDEG